MPNYESLPEFQKSAQLLKVQFVGSHGNGKSVLVAGTESLLRRHNIVPVRRIDELAQQLTDRGIQLNERTSLDTQLAILYIQAAEELLYRERGMHVVTDRSVLDNLGYALLKFGKDERYSNSELLDEAMRHVLSHMKYNPASHIFFVPLTNGKLVEDGTRSTDAEFQTKAEDVIQKLIKNNMIHHYRLPVVDGRDRGQWLSLVERTVFPDMAEESHVERLPSEEVWQTYLKLNPGITLANRLRRKNEGEERKDDAERKQRQPKLFRPYRIGDEITVKAGVEVRCGRTNRLIETFEISDDEL